jgi:hypothetical protein
MKLNFKKALPILATGLLVGSSFAFAISSIDQWKSFGSDTAIVIGADAMAIDTIAATDFNSALGITQPTQPVTGEAHLIEAPGRDLHYGDDLYDVEDTLEKRDLPTLLADGRYKESRGDTENDVGYKQFLEFTNGTGTITFTKNTEDPKKKVDTYLFFDDAKVAYTYRLVFDNPVKFNPAKVDKDFEMTKIKMLGRDYYIVDATVDADKKVDSLTLMGGALKASQWEYSKQTYTLGNKTYEVEVKIISDEANNGEGSVILVINGEETDEMAEGDTYTLEDGTRVGVLDVVPNEGAEMVGGEAKGNDLVTFYLGAEKIYLSQGDEVEINGKPIDGSNVSLQTNAADGELSEIGLSMKPSDDIFLAKGGSWSDQILGRFKFTYQGLVSETEEFKLTTSGNDGILEFTNVAGDKLEIPFVMDDASGNTYPGDELVLNANTTQNGNQGSKGNLLIADGDSCTGESSVTDCEGIKLLVVGTGGEARIIEVRNIDTTHHTVDLKEVSPGSTTWNDRDYTNSIVLGFATIQLSVEGNTITAEDINTCSRSVCNAGDFLTSLGGEIDIGFNGSNANISVFTDDGDNLADGTLAVLVKGTSDMEINPKNNALTWTTEEKDSNYDVAIDALNWGAIFRFNTDDKNELTWTYPKEKAVHKVYVSEILTTIPELVGGGGAVGNLVVLDTELTPDLKAKNLIVIGGSAVNRVAADLLGLSYPTYGSDEAWQKATGVSGEGQAIVKLLNNPYMAGKQALLVAGWEGSDTRKAAKAVVENIPGIAGKTSVKLDTSSETAVVIG